MTETGATKSHGRHNLRTFIAAAVLLVLVPILIVSAGAIGVSYLVGPACGCSSAPSPHPPGWTPTPPPPVSANDAAARASKLSGMSMTPNPDWATIAGTPVSEPKGEGAFAFVDGNSGTVLEVVMENQLPNSDTASVSTDAARSAAEAFLSRGGVTADGLTAQTQLVRSASVAFYQVTWSAALAAKTALEIRVNPSSGAVFAYRDLRSGVEVTAPILGYGAATRLASASSYSSGETPTPEESPGPDVQFYLGAPDGHEWTWMVGFPDGYLFVDAVTGEVWVAKWSSR